MFHYRDGWFFGRLGNGDVRVLKIADKSRGSEEWPKADGVYPEAEVDMTIEQCSWCSIIASVCPTGETSEAYEKAKTFHGVRYS